MHSPAHMLLIALLATLGGASPAQRADVSAASVREPMLRRVQNATFLASDADFANPERGFYRPLSTDLAQLAPDEVADAYAAGFRLLYARIDLAPYRGRDIPVAVLARFDAACDMARRGGVKLIVRAVYNYPRGETGYRQAHDAPLPRVLRHLAQLKPVFQRNADVIGFVQAGFVGAWGEWHTSSNALVKPTARDRIKDALLDVVPPDRFVQFRYPPYIAGWAPTLPSASAALAGEFRLGFHNDCFLASRTDVGTYEDDADKRADQLRYIDRLGDVAPFGGETCNPADDPGAVPRTGCDAILGEGRRFNLTYLNTAYYRPLFHDRWIAAGCMDEVRRRMGYRIALVSASHPATARGGGHLNLDVVVRNEGWARIYNPRAIQVVLRYRMSGRALRIGAAGTDPRAWLPGVDSKATLVVTLPRNLAVGTCDVLLALPDADRRLAIDPRYAIRFANSDDGAHGQRWDATLGAFALGTALTIE